MPGGRERRSVTRIKQPNASALITVKRRKRRAPGRVLTAFVLLLTAIGIRSLRAESPPAPTNGPVAATHATTNRVAASTNHYVIVPNDVVWLKVYQEDDLEARVKVTSDGTVTLPLIGVLTIAGKTAEEAATEIRDILDKRFIVNPQVSFAVIEYSKRKFTILGQVQRPGIYEYSGEENMTLLDAVAQAGGFTRLAAPSKVTLKRLEAGQVKLYHLGIEADLKNYAAPPFEIRPGDTINVGAKLF